MLRRVMASGRTLACLFVCLCFGLGASKALAVDPVIVYEPVKVKDASGTETTRYGEKKDGKVTPTIDINNGDNAWMLTSSALVLMMTGPGLALFYGGLVRRKNVLATMMQSFAIMALISVLWALLGYSLAFGSGNSFVGDLHNIFLRGVGLQSDPAYS